MTDAEKLTAVIEKVTKEHFFFMDGWKIRMGMRAKFDPGDSGLAPSPPKDWAIYLVDNHIVDLLLVDHKFAKAFWGFKPKSGGLYKISPGSPEMPNEYVRMKWRRWQFYLQRAVISDNMLDYYYERLGDK